MRAAQNTAVFCIFLGEYEAALALLQKALTKAAAFGISSLERDACCHTCTCYLMQEDFDSAELWYERTQHVAGSSSVVSYVHHSNGLELALWKRDTRLAEQRLAGVADMPLGDSVRLKSYMRGMETRIKQLDPHFNCSDHELQDLLTLHQASKRLTCCDGLTQAVAEALRRRGRISDARDILADYVHASRRERSPIPPSLAEVVRKSS
jgi:hypothetical protein